MRGFQGLPLYAIVRQDDVDNTEVPAMFTSEQDAERFCSEIPGNANGEQYMVIEVLAMHDYYAELDSEEDDNDDD